MKLTVMERMAILNILGPEGSLAFLRVKRDIVAKVGLTAEETEDFGVKEADGKMTWKLDVPQEREIPVSGAERAIVVEALQRLEKDGKLHESQLTLYEKFVE